MLTMVEVINDRNQNLQLPLASDTAGFLVKDIDGLDPVRASMSTSSLAKVDGLTFQSARRDERNIVMTLGLRPDYVTHTMQSLRRELYSAMTPKSNVTLKFYFDNEYQYYITGRVETLDTPIFAKEPEATISILCFNPDFKTAENTVLNLFTEHTYTRQIIDYEGTVETGFILRYTFDRDVTDLDISNLDQSGNLLEMRIFMEAVAGDVLEINTIVGEKDATIYRSSGNIPALGLISLESTWFPLRPGPNEFVTVAGGETPIPYTLEYQPKFVGL